jgi:hypothetical protein
MVKNFHQHPLVGSAVAREMVTPEDVSVIVVSGLKRSGPYLSRGAREAAKGAVHLDELNQIRSLKESEMTAQEASIVAEDLRKAELRVANNFKRKTKVCKEKGLKPPKPSKPTRTGKKQMSWGDRYDELRAYMSTRGHLPQNKDKCKLGLASWASDKHKIYKNKKRNQERIGRIRNVGIFQADV